MSREVHGLQALIRKVKEFSFYVNRRRCRLALVFAYLIKKIQILSQVNLVTF